MCSTCLMLLVQQASLMFCIISFASSRAFGLCCCLSLPELPVEAPFIRATGGGRCCDRTRFATLMRLKRLFLPYGVSLPYFILERRSVDLPILIEGLIRRSAHSMDVTSIVIATNLSIPHLEHLVFLWNLLCVSTDWILRRFESIGIASSIIDGCYQLLV